MAAVMGHVFFSERCTCTAVKLESEFELNASAKFGVGGVTEMELPASVLTIGPVVSATSKGLVGSTYASVAMSLKMSQTDIECRFVDSKSKLKYFCFV